MRLHLTSLTLLLGIVLATAQVPDSSKTAPSHYMITGIILVGGEGGWDCLAVDESTGRLFLSHSTQVDVVDPGKGRVAGIIPDTRGVHAIAIADDLGKGFVTNGKDSSVTVFDVKSLKTLAKIPVTGKNPDAILYDRFSHRVFAFNGKSSNATVIDAKKDSVIATIPFDGKPELPATDNNGKVFVNIEDKSEIAVIDAESLKVTQQWPVTPGEEPTGLALDQANHRLFSVCSNQLMIVMDALTGKVVASLPIGKRVDGVAFDPETKRAFSSNGEGTVTVVEEMNPDSFKVVETIPTRVGARTIALNTKTHHFYLPTAEFGKTPEPTKENQHPRPEVKPGTFMVLDVGPGK